MNYDFEIDRICEEIKKEKANLVGLQFPEGLKKHAIAVAKEIEERTRCTTVIFIDPCYGACDTKEMEAERLGLDIMVHFGHDKWLR